MFLKRCDTTNMQCSSIIMSTGVSLVSVYAIYFSQGGKGMFAGLYYYLMLSSMLTSRNFINVAN